MADLDAQSIEKHHRIHRVEGARLPRGDFRRDAVGDGADEVRRHLDGIHLRKKGLDLADGHPAGVQRQHFVVEAREPALVLTDQAWLKRPFTIAGHLNRDRAVVCEDGLATRAVAVIARVVRLRATRRVAEMMRQLAAQRALDERCLEAADRGIELLGGDRSFPDELIQNL